MQNKVAHFEIMGDNPEKLGEFYKKLFGWKIDKTRTLPRTGANLIE
ncbi:MAG: VOC family protein [Armatimonadota bacterium]